MDERAYLEDAAREFRSIKEHADRALAQADDAAWFAQLDAESNSLAIIVKHMAGKLRSRWREFLTTDGEKPDRNRDSEFVIEPGETKESLLARWEAGWKYLFDTLASLTPADLDRTVLIRSEPHTVPKAIHRALAHAAGHAGQVVFLAKHLVGARWKTLSIPRGKSAEFNAAMQASAKRST